MTGKTIGELYREKRRWSERRELYNAIVEGRIKIRDPSPPTDLVEYITRLDYSCWYWTVLLLVIATVIVEFAPVNPVFVALRFILGSLATLFLPGYSLIEALFPTRILKPIEKFFLSIGASLALLPLIALFLDYTGLRILREPVIGVVTLFIIGVSSIGLYRKYLLFKEGQS